MARLSAQDDKSPAAVLRRFLDEVWNAHDLDAFPRFVSRDVRFHPPRGEPRAYDAYLAMAREFLQSFPDLHFTAERIHGDATHASTRLVIEGTNDGPFRGRAPTGRRVRVIGQPQCRVEGGRIVEFWQLFDELGMLHQLGHVEDAALLGASDPHAQP